MANALRVVCSQSWYSSQRAVSPLFVSFTPLLEGGGHISPFGASNDLGVVRRVLPPNSPVVEQLGVLLLRNELEQLL
jgi:hypothetical protein